MGSIWAIVMFMLTSLLQGPNYCWHMDGYDKLSMFGFAIHGCIDGYVIMMTLDSFLLNNCIHFTASLGKVLWLKVGSTNHDPAVVLHYYLGCVKSLRGKLVVINFLFHLGSMLLTLST